MTTFLKWILTCVLMAAVMLFITTSVYQIVLFGCLQKHMLLSTKHFSTRTHRRPNEENSRQKVMESFDTYLENHKVFRHFNITKFNNTKKRANVLVIISTAPKRRDRRDAIRKTYWKECVKTGPVSKNYTVYKISFNYLY